MRSFDNLRLNFTRTTVDRKAENLIVMDSPEVISLYRENYRKHMGHSHGM